MSYYTFTSESVSEGHPDKLCDQVSDAILDAFIKEDPNSRVAVETAASKDLLIVAGEIRSESSLDIEAIARKTCLNIGYDANHKGLDGANCRFISNIQQQSADIAQGVDEGEGKFKSQGAGDQGIMFGYACRQTESFMPLPIALSHQLMDVLQQKRHQGLIQYLCPDAKAQVSIRYENNTPTCIETVVISTQHLESVSYEQLESDMIALIKQELPSHLITQDTRYLINPTGRFVLGGPSVDTGLTGRKIIVDTYGGWAQHGGGAFSGKDPSKVDRSAAYMARYVAKNVVAAGLAQEALIQLSYAIGYEEPVSVYVDTKGSSELSSERLEQVIRTVFDLRPAGIIETLNLKQPIYGKTASLGHFGRDGFSWEALDKIDALQEVSKSMLVST